jgi:hypothetical protein
MAMLEQEVATLRLQLRDAQVRYCRKITNPWAHSLTPLY